MPTFTYYINRTGKPLTVPTERGISELVPPGAFVTRPWYARFSLPGMLTAETIDVPEGHPNPALYVLNTLQRLRSHTSRVENPEVELGESSSPQTPQVPPLEVGTVSLRLPQLANEDAPDYKIVDGVYYCRHCNRDPQFATGSRWQLTLHLADTHGIEVQSRDIMPLTEALKETLHAVDLPEPTEQIAPSRATPMEVPESVLDGTRSESDGKTETPRDAFVCQFCSSRFRSRETLDRHVDRKHKQK